MLIDRMQKLFALWIKIAVAGVACCMVIPESLHAQRSPRFDYFFLEASSCMRADDMASASELFQHCLERICLKLCSWVQVPITFATSLNM